MEYRRGQGWGDDVHREGGKTVFDYVIGDSAAWERVERLEVRGEID